MPAGYASLGQQDLEGAAGRVRLIIKQAVTAEGGVQLRRMFVEDESRSLTASLQRASPGARTRRKQNEVTGTVSWGRSLVEQA